MSETWLSPNIPDVGLNIPGFKLIRNDRHGRGGGVAFYIKNSIQFSVLATPLVNSPLEQLWISAKVEGKKLCLGTLYRPPNTNLNNCLEDLESVLVNFLPEFDFVVFGGDFNVDFLSQDYNFAQFNSFLNKYGLHQAVTKPTRVNNTSSTLIDLIISNCKKIILDSGVFNMDDISDHSLVTCNLNIKRNEQTTLFRTYRDFSNFEHEVFLNDLQSVNWDFIYSLEDVDQMIEFWNNNLTLLYDMHAPLKRARIKKPPAPWLTPNLKFLMKQRDKARLRYKRLQSEISLHEYRSLRNFVNMCVRTEKKAYLREKFKTDPKNFWRTLKWLNIGSCKENIVLDFASPTDINNFFVNNVPKVDQDYEFIANAYTNKVIPHIVTKFNFTEVTVDKVEQKLGLIKSNAKGADGIDLTMLSFVIPQLSKHLTFIINKCLLTSTYPCQWKRANVIPIPKTGNPTDISQFRPISILPIISKILEKIVHEQLSNYLDTNNILPPTQSGFRPHHSTTTAMVQITDDIFRACDANYNVCLVLLDFSKAFDTLNHNTLCTKLNYFGLSTSAVLFFQNYLRGRCQRVGVNNVFSEFIDIPQGVPQGSILGPLLFSLYTADLYKHLKFCQSHQYADDTQIYYPFPLVEMFQAAENINVDLESISKVSNAHGLLLNESKTQVLLFGKDRDLILQNANFKIILNNSVLNPIDCCKNLGIYLDVQLRFSKHVSNLIQKSFAKLRILSMHKDILSKDIKLRLCDSLILSYLAYCDIVYWPALLQRDRDSLQKVQNSCLRFCYNLRKFDHVSNKFNECKWLTLNERFQVHLVCLVFKINCTQLPSYLQGKLTKGSDIHSCPTRHCQLFSVPRHSTSLFQRSFSYNAVKTYNELPEEFKALNSLEAFRRRVKTYIFGKRN